MEIKGIELLNKNNANKKLSIGSGCVIIEEDKVLLVRGKGGEKFKFPGGHIIDTENFHESAKREVFEEIACEVEIVNEPIFYLFEASEELNIILIHYLASISKGNPTASTEIEEIRWFDLDEIPENVFDNVIPVLNTIKTSAA